MTLLDAGHSQSEVARRLGVTPAAVSQWVKARREGGEKALAARPAVGRPPSLSDRQLKRLEKLLRKGPTRCGFATELWTLKRVAALIEKEFDQCYDPSGVWHLLKRIGWSCQKPERRAWERDEAAIEQWRKQHLPRIKERREEAEVVSLSPMKEASCSNPPCATRGLRRGPCCRLRADSNALALGAQ